MMTPRQLEILQSVIDSPEFPRPSGFSNTICREFHYYEFFGDPRPAILDED
jgi:hypothetical protein